MSKSAKSFIFHGGILAIAGILVRIIGMLYRIPMVNIIGSEGNGIYGVAFNIYNIVLILSSYGIPMAVSKLISARIANKEYKNSAKILKSALIFSIISGGIAMLVLLFGAGAIQRFLYPTVSGLEIPLRVLAPTVFIVAVLGVFRGLFQGQGNMIPTAISQLIEQIVNAVVSIVASYALMRAFIGSEDNAAYGAAGGTLGTCLGALAALVVVIVIFLRVKNKYKTKMYADTSDVELTTKVAYKSIIFTLFPIVLGQTFYNISTMLDDIFFSNMMAGKMDSSTIKTMLGNYSSSYVLLLSIPQGIASAMAASMLPSVVKSYATHDIHHVKLKIKKTVRITMMVSIPFVFGLAALGEPVVHLLFRNYDSAVGGKMLLLGSSAIIFYTLSTISSSALQGINKMRVPVIHSFISLAIHIPLLLILFATTDLGVYALVIGVMTFSGLIFVLNFISLYKYIGYRQEIFKTFIIPLMCSAVMGLVALLVYIGLYSVVHINIVALAAAVVVAVLVYFGLLILMKKKKLY